MRRAYLAAGGWAVGLALVAYLAVAGVAGLVAELVEERTGR